MGRFMSPGLMVSSRRRIWVWDLMEGGHTLAVFEPLLYKRVVDVGQYLELLEVFAHAHELPVLGLFSAHGRCVSRLYAGYSSSFYRYLSELLLSVSS